MFFREGTLFGVVLKEEQKEHRHQCSEREPMVRHAPPNRRKTKTEPRNHYSPMSIGLLMFSMGYSGTRPKPSLMKALIAELQGRPAPWIASRAWPGSPTRTEIGVLGGWLDPLEWQANPFGAFFFVSAQLRKRVSPFVSPQTQ